MQSEENKKYWENFNADYSSVWKSRGRQEMSKKELNFINNYLVKYSPNKILDAGVGNGRILANTVKVSKPEARIFGIDVSDKMVGICKERFKNEPKIKQISVCDLSQENICFDDDFDFITMIRVLKYNKNWREIIKKVYGKLNNGGTYIFTIPNKKSIAYYSGDKFTDQNISILYASQDEIKKVLTDAGFKLIESRSFSKMPNFLYHICQNKIYVKSLLFIEKILEMLFGKVFLGRVMFVVCQK